MKPDIIVNFENTPSDEALRWITAYENKGDPHAVILDENEIAQLNEKIRESCPTVHKMDEIPESIHGTDVASWIGLGKPPFSQKLDRDGKPITRERIDAIEANKNLSAIPTSVRPQTAIVTKRTNIRTIPTPVNFYDETDEKQQFDRIQEAELILGTPVLILHESTDGVYRYVQSYYYRGWVKAEALALTDHADYMRFLPERLTDFVTVTADTVTLASGEKLDMGAAFPYISSTGDSFTAELPCRDEAGKLYTKSVTLPKKHSHYGRLPYTYSNFVTQAFKFLGTEYSWGGYNEGVDCSGFVCAVFRSFGIFLPRNTGEQKDHAGSITPLAGMEKDAILETLGSIVTPSAIFRPGHVMLYLGIDDGKIYVIHAPSGGDRKVTVAPLTKTENLTAAATIK